MKELLRSLPKIDELQRCPVLAELCLEYGDSAVTDGIRREIEALRQGILAEQVTTLPDRDALLRQIAQRVRRDSLPSFRSVINGTGIILHTNLGRACLSEKAAQAAADAARRYTTLEYDLQSGSRAPATAMWRSFCAV